ncbi:unnamed protein product [Leuciscus chuanchicus]
MRFCSPSKNVMLENEESEEEEKHHHVKTNDNIHSQNEKAHFINCKPFYSPWEFSSFILVNVYIPPDTRVSAAPQQLAEQIAETEQSRHFNKDLIEPSTPNGRRLLRKGAAPTLFQWNGYSVAEPRRTGVWQRRDTQVDEVPVPMDAHYLEHDYCSVPEPATVDNALDQTEDLHKKVERLMRQVEDLSVSQRFCLGRFAASDDDIRFYTRVSPCSPLMISSSS